MEFLCGLGPPPSQLNLTEYSSASYGVRVDGNAAFSSAVCYCPDVDIDNSGGSCDGPADYVQPVGRLLVFGTRLCGDDACLEEYLSVGPHSQFVAVVECAGTFACTVGRSQIKVINDHIKI